MAGSNDADRDMIPGPVVPLMLTPGPSMLAQEVREVLRTYIPHHREELFRLAVRECIGSIERWSDADGAVYPLTCSGRGGLEAAIVNAFSPGDTVLVCINGFFGELFAKIAGSFQLHVIPLRLPDHRPIDIDLVTATVRAHPEIRGVLAVHSETSTGVLNDVRSLAASLRDRDVLLIVDAMSSFGSCPIHVSWGIDAIVGCSQKGLMCPPGIAVIAASRRYVENLPRVVQPRSYWDLTSFAEPLAKEPPLLPYTPATAILMALQRALNSLERRGKENVFQSHRFMAETVREGISAMGLTYYTRDLDPRYCSPTVTTLVVPEGVAPERLLDDIRVHHGVLFGTNFGPLSQNTIRIGHMGAVTLDHLYQGFEALSQSLIRLGAAIDPDSWRDVFEARMSR